MNPGAENLLRGILEEVLPPDREARLLATTLREVERRRRRRELGRRGMVVAALTLVVALAALDWTRPPATTATAAVSSTTGVSSESAAIPVIASQSLSPACVVRTSWGVTPVIESHATSVVSVETASEPQRAALLTDDELLALLAGKPAALVRRDGETRLVLAGARWTFPR